MSRKRNHSKKWLVCSNKTLGLLQRTTFLLLAVWHLNWRTTSEKQLKTKLKAWNFDVKYVNGKTMVQLARARAKRQLENKDSSFRVHKKPVDVRKIDRYVNRNDITDEELLNMPSPINRRSLSVASSWHSVDWHKINSTVAYVQRFHTTYGGAFACFGDDRLSICWCQ